MILDRVDLAPVLHSAPALDDVRALLGRLRATLSLPSDPAGRSTYWAGFAAYQEGLDLGDNPHRTGSRKAETWTLGWYKGLED